MAELRQRKLDANEELTPTSFTSITDRLESKNTHGVCEMTNTKRRAAKNSGGRIWNVYRNSIRRLKNRAGGRNSSPLSIHHRYHRAKEEVDSEEDKLDLSATIPSGTNKTPPFFESVLTGLSDRWRNWFIRFISTALMSLVFLLIIYGGPLALMITTLAIQVKCFEEIINIGYAVYRIHGLPWFRSLSWYFLITSNYFFYGESLIDYFSVVINRTDFLRFLVNYHRFISFSLYIVGFVWFVLSLVNKYYMKQFSLFAWTHVALLIVVTQSYLIIQNIFEGLIWFIVPVTMIITNDVWAYIFGFFFGRTPLIKVSPKKTWEGFIGGGVATVVFGAFLSYFLCRFEFFICPIEYNETLGRMTMECEPSPLFRLQEYSLPRFLSSILNTNTITIQPFVLHSFALSIFSSVIGPFGGFFASGFKRAFKIKDFGDVIPGHGGIMDRFDCQFLMATFVNVYISSFIRSPSPQKLIQQVFTLKPEQQLQLFYTLKESLENRGILNDTISSCDKSLEVFSDSSRCPSEASILSSSSLDICKICHCEGSVETPLITPCYCAGSLRYVHQSCLQQWIKSSNTRSCELCKFHYIMHTKVKPFSQWEYLEMSGVERKKIVCAMAFHVFAMTCVCWSLYVLIDRTLEEVRRGRLEWPFWSKLIVVGIGFMGGVVFMFIQCKAYFVLCRRWKAYNRVIYVQNAPEKPLMIRGTVEVSGNNTEAEQLQQSQKCGIMATKLEAGAVVGEMANRIDIKGVRNLHIFFGGNNSQIRVHRNEQAQTLQERDIIGVQQNVEPHYMVSSNRNDHLCGSNSARTSLHIQIGGGSGCTAGTSAPTQIHHNVVKDNRALGSSGGSPFCQQSESVNDDPVVRLQIAKAAIVIEFEGTKSGGGSGKSPAGGKRKYASEEYLDGKQQKQRYDDEKTANGELSPSSTLLVSRETEEEYVIRSPFKEWRSSDDLVELAASASLPAVV